MGRVPIWGLAVSGCMSEKIPCPPLIQYLVQWTGGSRVGSQDPGSRTASDYGISRVSLLIALRGHLAEFI